MSGDDERFSRQGSILLREGLNQNTVAVAGVGAVGRQLCLQLAAAGQRRVVYYDHDTIEEGNLGAQGWRVSDVGMSKTAAIARDVSEWYGCSAPDWVGVACRFPLEIPDVKAIFFCVDSIGVRRRLFEAHAARLQRVGGALFDARVAGEVMRIICCCEPEDWSYYPRTLFAEHDAMPVACTARMTIHLASLAAALLVQQYALWMRRVPGMMRDLVCNWAAMEILPRNEEIANAWTSPSPSSDGR